MSDMRDEYGNPVRQTDEYGNPVGQTHGGTMGSYGTQGTGTDGRVGGGHGAAHAGGGHMQEHRGGGGGQTGILHRSGSSSSSSSEDDEQGGRRKKGMKQKIKEKIPGVGGKETDPHHTGAMGQQTGTYGQIHEQEYYGADQGCEKKGITEKIKQKIPGVGGNEKDPRQTSATVGNQPMGQQTTYGQQHQGEHCGQEEHEKKGIMDKIKEKLPGGGHSREA